MTGKASGLFAASFFLAAMLVLAGDHSSRAGALPRLPWARNPSGPAADRKDWPSKLTIAYPLIGTRDETLARWASLNAFLSEKLGLKIKPAITDGYTPINIGFRQKKMDVAYMGPLSYLELKEYAEVEPVVMELAAGGQAGYHAILIARKNSRMKKVMDGKGKVLAMVNQHSTSGFLIPTLYLLKTYKLTPQAFARQVVFTNSHELVIEGVAKGLYDLGATNDIDLARACREKGFAAKDFLILWKSGLYPASPYAARKDLPPSLRQALRGAMLAVNQEPTILADLGIGGFAAVEDSAYDLFREQRALLK